MSAAPRLPAILASITALTTTTALLLIPRQYLPPSISRHLPANLRGPVLKALAALFLLANLKNLPGAWHVRVIRAIYYQIYTSPLSLSGRDLFKPLVTTSRNTVLDCDYNLHKSNSTYFADLDVARAHFIGALLRTSLRRLNAGDREGLPKNAQQILEAIEAQERSEGKEGTGAKSKVPTFYIIALGGIACVFRKEIKPLEKFEVWTRLLSWDGKWIYVVSHIVKAGSLRPSGYHLAPWQGAGVGRLWYSVFGAGKAEVEAEAEAEATRLEGDMKSAVFATSIAKYVCKKGRLTIAPELVLQRSYLLPSEPKPAHSPDLVTGFVDKAKGSAGGGEGTEAGAQSEADLMHVSRMEVNGTGSASGSGTPSSAELAGPEAAAAAAASGVASAPGDPAGAEQSAAAGRDVQTLSWDEIERMRVRGLEYAKMFDGLTGLHDEFGKDGSEVLGVYPDFLY